MSLAIGEPITGLSKALGEFFLTQRSLNGDARGHIPVFQQVLSAEAYYVAFEPGSPTHQVLSNDQNRFSPPRSLPPI
ncbi:MAG: hypothetical protein V3T77_05445, partial [Planctomycetota bacterium]